MEINKSLPDDSRIWIFALNQRLSAEKKAVLQSRLERFASSWRAHGEAVGGQAIIFADQLILLVASAAYAATSGCSIDQMTREVHAACEEMGLILVQPSEILVQSDLNFEVLSRSQFKQAVQEGRLNLDSIVVDTTISKISDLRADKLVLPVKNSWHCRLVS